MRGRLPLAVRFLLLLLPSSRGSSCGHLLGPVGLGGTNLPTSYGDPALNVSRCCLACDAAAGCVGWTLNRKQQKCFLKAAVTGRRSRGPQYMASGLANAPPPPPPPLPPPNPPPPGAKNILFVPMDDQRPR